MLKLMYAALIRASQTWRRVVISEFELKQIDEIEGELDQEFKQRTASAVSSAFRPKIYSKDRALTNQRALSNQIAKFSNVMSRSAVARSRVALSLPCSHYRR